MNQYLPYLNVADADLKIYDFKSAVVSSDIIVTWSVDDSVDKCIKKYRISYGRKDETPTEVIIDKKLFAIPKTVPCTEYNIEVSVALSPTKFGPPTSYTTKRTIGKFNLNKVMLCTKMNYLYSPF